MGRRRTRTMSRRAVQWIITFAAADLLVFGLTLHTALTYDAGSSSPSVMPLSELVGWVVSAVLLVVVVLIVKESRR